ncbi:MAG: hypothetical protein HQK49_07635 [Oligoflexia bacterium]|nr:hypothetical protein [Oligoflexia bacterium]
MNYIKFNWLFFLSLSFLLVLILMIKVDSKSLVQAQTKITNTEKNDLTVLKFDPNEKCDTEENRIETAKKAGQLACKWIEEIGAGSKDDPNSAFAMISKRRFCGEDYVAVLRYFEGMTAKSHIGEFIVLLHPVKPGLEKLKNPHTDMGNGYLVGEQHNAVGDLHPAGCWIPYLWTKPGTEIKREKITFVLRCKDKLTGMYMLPSSGIYASHTHLKKLNPPECKGAEDKNPYKNKN